MANPSVPFRVPPDRLSKPGVLIIGFTEHRKLAFDEVRFPRAEWERWTLNEIHRWVDYREIDRWFEIHPREDLEGDPEHLKALAGMDIPVYMQRHHDDIPPSVPFPAGQVEARVGKYETSSIAWMMGLAITFGAKRIAIVGVDMATDCLAPGTRVLTAGLRWSPIEDIRIGDTLLAFDEEAEPPRNGRRAGYRKWRTSTVLAAHELVRPSYRVTLEDGTEFVASAGHGWLTHAENQHRWRRTDELSGPHHRKNRPTRAVRVLDTWDDAWTREGGYLAAALDGEGHLSQQRHTKAAAHGLNIGFSQRENEMADAFRSALEHFGFGWTEHDGKPTGYGRASTVVTKKMQVRGGKAELMRLLGQVRPHRLLAKFDPDKLGMLQSKENVAITSIEFVGDQKVIGLRTTTGTIVAEGFAMHNSEYANERPCVEYMIGLARGLGIDVWVPPTSDLLKAVGQYGFGAVGSEFASKLKERIGWLHGQDNEWLAQVRKLEGEYEETKARMRFDQRRQRDKLDAEYRAKRDQLLANRWQVMGAIEDCDFWKRSWAVTGGHEPGKPTPDRTQDPRTGIKATVPGTDSKDEGAPNRVAKEMAA